MACNVFFVLMLVDYDTVVGDVSYHFTTGPDYAWPIFDFSHTNIDGSDLHDRVK